jgi:hypothetical protein
MDSRSVCDGIIDIRKPQEHFEVVLFNIPSTAGRHRSWGLVSNSHAA